MHIVGIEARGGIRDPDFSVCVPFCLPCLPIFLAVYLESVARSGRGIGHGQFKPSVALRVHRQHLLLVRPIRFAFRDAQADLRAIGRPKAETDSPACIFFQNLCPKGHVMCPGRHAPFYLFGRISWISCRMGMSTVADCCASAWLAAATVFSTRNSVTSVSTVAGLEGNKGCSFIARR